MPYTEPMTEPEDQNEDQPRFRCRHILTDGHRCQSPCLRQQEFCYYHHTTRRPIANPRQRRSRRSTFELPNPEDRAAIQTSIGEVLRRIAANDIDPRRAGLLLYGLQIASSNLPKIKHAPPRKTDDIPDTVQDIILDPALGLLAPPAHCQPTRRESLISLLNERLEQDPELVEYKRKYAESFAKSNPSHAETEPNHDNPQLQPSNHPSPATHPAVLPNLQAAEKLAFTSLRVPHVRLFGRGLSRTHTFPIRPPAVRSGSIKTSEERRKSCDSRFPEGQGSSPPRLIRALPCFLPAGSPLPDR